MDHEAVFVADAAPVLVSGVLIGACKGQCVEPTIRVAERESGPCTAASGAALPYEFIGQSSLHTEHGGPAALHHRVFGLGDEPQGPIIDSYGAGRGFSSVGAGRFDDSRSPGYRGNGAVLGHFGNGRSAAGPDH